MGDITDCIRFQDYAQTSFQFSNLLSERLLVNKYLFHLRLHLITQE